MASVHLNPDPEAALEKEIAGAVKKGSRVKVDPTSGIRTEVKKYRKTTQDDEAMVIALKSEGNTDHYISRQTGMNHRTVNYVANKNAEKIAAFREEKLRDRIEDYDRCIAKLFIRLEECIDAGEIEPKDVIKGLDVLVKKRLLIQGQPTAVHAVVNEAALSDLDELATDPKAYLENHAAVRKAAIKLLAQRDGEELIEGEYEVVEDGGDAGGNDG